ncbi:unnamed protein product [Polarella glacialis]|uniref:Transmembrane 9 superfamily member n=1 Tax=Polarella glacialis TaxID=89957 RepID=A0A813GZI5_POLGL|nr:unnamed protein product [Polarella glacialis]
MWQQALGLLRALQNSAVEPDVAGVSSAMSACGRGGQWAWALQLFSDFQRKGGLPNLVCYNTLIAASQRSSRWRLALLQLGDISLAGLVPDTFSFNAAISACARADCWQRPLALLAALQRRCHMDSQGATSSLKNQRSDLSIISYNATLGAFLSGSRWEHALRLIAEASADAALSNSSSSNSNNNSSRGGGPDAESFGAAIGACEAASQWRQALCLLQAALAGSARSGLPPDGLCQASALGACEQAAGSARRRAEILALLQCHVLTTIRSTERRREFSKAGEDLRVTNVLRGLGMLVAGCEWPMARVLYSPLVRYLCIRKGPITDRLPGQFGLPATVCDLGPHFTNDVLQQIGAAFWSADSSTASLGCMLVEALLHQTKVSGQLVSDVAPRALSLVSAVAFNLRTAGSGRRWVTGRGLVQSSGWRDIQDPIPITKNQGGHEKDAVSVTSLLHEASAFYLPGLAPREYQKTEKVELRVNKLTSAKTQLPFGYYSLPYCQPEGGIKEAVENLGEQMTGDLVENSAYDINLLEVVQCTAMCTKKLDKTQKDKFRNMIEDEYLVNWMVDNLPAATRYRQTGSDYMYMNGFLVGIPQNGKYYLHNHVTLDLHYHTNPEKYEGFRIVGFEVEPRSATAIDGKPDCGATPTPLDLDAEGDIIFSYSVEWTESPIRWASRWDAYLKMSGAQIHWFAILNSLLILLFLSGMIAMILLRTLHRDIATYNEIPTTEEAKEETGWKLVHGDVFRKPNHSTLLTVFVGSGMQLLGMSVVTLVFAVLGFLSPAHRGSLLQSMMLLFTIMGVAGGYTSARLCKVFDGDEGRWKMTTLLNAFMFPGLFFAIFFFLNLCIWHEKSSGAVPFSTMFALLVLWFGVSVPLVFFGAYAGFRRDRMELPVRTNQIPRAIPEQQWYMGAIVTSLVGGILPFGAVFTELFFIMSSLWLHQFYYLFGFLSLVLVIVVITCAEISIALTYFQLTTEDYRWWWTAFSASASSAIYVFLYSIFYFNTRLQINHWVSVILYYGYMLIISIIFALITGTIGLLSSLQFVKGIYGSIKID